MKKLAALLRTTRTQVFVNSNAGGKFYVCATPQPTDLLPAAFAALTWVQVKNVGNLGQTGTDTNVLKYDTWDTTVTQKSKGIADAGSPQIEVARDGNDAGQSLMRAACASKFNYAFKIERPDLPNSNPGSKPTTIYNRGMVTGPTHPNGKNEDFDLEVFTLALNQQEIVVEAVAVGSGAVAPDAPIIDNLVAAPGGFTLTFHDGATGGAPITANPIYISTVSGFTPGPTNLYSADVGASPYSPTGFTPGQEIYIRLGATNAVGTTLAAEINVVIGAVTPTYNPALKFNDRRNSMYI